MVLAQNITHEPHILYSLKAAQTWCMRILSLFVTRPRPEPVSSARRLMINSFSCLFRKLAVSGLSGRTFQITKDKATGMRPSRMKLEIVSKFRGLHWYYAHPLPTRTPCCERVVSLCTVGINRMLNTDQQHRPCFRYRRLTDQRMLLTDWLQCRRQPFGFGPHISCTTE
jgi:hypothetical protein